MSEVILEFDDRFREPMLGGRKTATVRKSPMAFIGDTFEAFGATFEVVELLFLPWIRLQYVWWLLGFDSEAYCGTYLEDHYPDKKANLWLHQFKRIK